MKGCLAKTLVSGALALAVLAGAWIVLERRSTSVLEEARARWDASGAPQGANQVLPPIDAAQDAGPIYTQVARSWASAGADKSAHEAQVRERMHAAAQLSACRLWRADMRDLDAQTIAGLAALTQDCLLPAADRAQAAGDADGAWTAIESVLALAAHLREDPLVASLVLSRVIAAQGFEKLRAFLGVLPLDAAHARQLLASVQRLHPEFDVLRALDGERVLVAEPAWESLVGERALLAPWRRLDEKQYLELAELAREQLASKPWEPLAVPEVPEIYPVTRVMSAGFAKLGGAWVLEERHARDLAEIALRLAIARAESGRYPDELAELGAHPIEPVSRRGYSYTRDGAGCTLALPEGPHSAGTTWSLPR
ncbi:MAG: hypothetical protein IPJ19_04430 [Planctomycetes bacterium]|nr:hypothetical protein [Planctomycetota bacterium]